MSRPEVKSLIVVRFAKCWRRIRVLRGCGGVDSASYPLGKHRRQNTPAHSALRRALFASVSQSRLLWNLDKQLGVLHRRHSHWPGRKRSVVRTMACLAIWLLKTTATRMRDRKSVERSGVADPISERWGRPYITYVEVCLRHICVAVVVCGEEMYSSPFCPVGALRWLVSYVEPQAQ